MNNSGENVRALKIDSSQHSMAARLYIKDTEQGQRFVVNFMTLISRIKLCVVRWMTH